MTNTHQRLLAFVTRANWLLLLAAGVAGSLLASPAFATGIILGGLIVTVNFHLLARTLNKALRSPLAASSNSVLAKYYIRFAASGLLILLLIANRVVDPIGLCIGLSVVVASITMATVMEIRNLFTKEAS